jgi:glucokinase
MIGVDFGGTHIKAGVVEDGRIARVLHVDTHAGSGPAELLGTIARVVRELDAAPNALGVAIPGEVDSEGKCWRLPNVPGFEGVPIARELSGRLGCRVVVENDATTAALGEHLYGHGREHSSFLLATLGTGVGGGLVLRRKLWRGKSGFAGEIGHITIEATPEAWPCACGKRGCMEAYAGTRGLLRKHAELGGDAKASIADIAARAHQGDAAAREVFSAMGHALGTGLAQIQNVLDLDALVFAGGISASFDLIQPTLSEALAARAFSPPLASVPLLVSTVGEHIGVIGAACLPAHHD